MTKCNTLEKKLNQSEKSCRFYRSKYLVAKNSLYRQRANLSRGPDARKSRKRARPDEDTNGHILSKEVKLDDIPSSSDQETVERTLAENVTADDEK